MMFELAITRGASDTAVFIAQQTAYGRRHLQESYSLGLLKKGVFNDLYTIAEECSSANWDGYGSEPVKEETYRCAYRFLEALPLGSLAPTIGAEADGHVTIEWHRSHHCTLSVSVSPEGDLHYSALLGASKVYGAEPFFGDIPEPILNLIKRVSIV